MDDLAIDHVKPKERFDVPIIFVHGMWSSSWHWKNFMEYFSKNGFSCRALNLRGHGDKKSIGKASTMDYVEDVMKAIDQIESMPIVIGHSMGGLITQKVAELLDIKGAVCICPAPPRGIRPIPRISCLLKMMGYIPAIISKSPIFPKYKVTSHCLLNCLDESTRVRVYKKMTPESAVAAKEAFLGKISVDESMVTCPILVIAGEEDKVTPPKIGEKIAEKYGSDFNKYSRHAHWIIEENGWEKVAEDIIQWIKKNVT